MPGWALDLLCYERLTSDLRTAGAIEWKARLSTIEARWTWGVRTGADLVRPWDEIE